MHASYLALDLRYNQKDGITYAGADDWLCLNGGFHIHPKIHQFLAQVAERETELGFAHVSADQSVRYHTNAGRNLGAILEVLVTFRQQVLGVEQDLQAGP